MSTRTYLRSVLLLIDVISCVHKSRRCLKPVESFFFLVCFVSVNDCWFYCQDFDRIWHEPAELAHFSFFFLYSTLVSVSVFMALSTCISFRKFSQQLSAFSLCFSGLISALLVLSTMYLFTKVSFAPDIILCNWLGLKHQLTNQLTN